jgi:hypothetical protein
MALSQISPAFPSPDSGQKRWELHKPEIQKDKLRWNVSNSIKDLVVISQHAKLLHEETNQIIRAEDNPAIQNQDKAKIWKRKPFSIRA